MVRASRKRDSSTPAQDPGALPSLSTRVEWVEDWEEATLEARKLARRDRRYYDNEQWTEAELERLRRRKQPALTKNKIARKVNYILGEEIEKRVDPVGKPRTPAHTDSARASTDALRFVEEEQGSDKARSAVLKNMLIEGFGGALKELEQDGGEYKHVLRHIEWDRLAYDPHSRAPDFGDATWIGDIAWLDLDDAIRDYPDAADALRKAVDNGVARSDDTSDDTPRGWADKKKRRVKLFEMFFRFGEDWYRAVFTEGVDIVPPERTWLLNEKRTHSVCPLRLMSCYVDSNGNRYGIVRQLISPQDEINKRSSKALHAGNTVQVISETAQITDPSKFMEELAKPDGFATGIAPGAMASGAVQIRTNAELVQHQLELLQNSYSDIDGIGPSSATIPELPTSASGRAMQMRRKAAQQELGTIFDQLRQWTKSIYELDWLSIRQYWTEEKWLRVSDDKELTGYRFVALNRRVARGQRLQELLQQGAPLESALDAAAGSYAPMVMAQAQQMAQAVAQQAQAQGQQAPEGDQAIVQMLLRHPLMSEPVAVNQVDQMLVDIVIDEAPETAILAEEQFDTLGEIMPPVIQARPDLAPVLVKSLLRASSLPDKREILAEMDKPQGPDPQAQQLQQQVQVLQLQLQQATIAVEQTKAQLQQAQTEKTLAEAQAIPARTAAEVQSQQAQAMSHAATAGQKAAPQVPNGFGKAQAL